MTWRQIADQYKKVVGSSNDAWADRWLNLNYAHRHICAMLEVPELHSVNNSVSTVANQDYVTTDADIYSIDEIVLQDTGRKLEREPGGFRGRSRYYESGQSRPPVSSNPQFYVRRGANIYLRDTPDDVYTLLVSWRVHPDDLSDSDYATSPLPPEQYHQAIFKLAAANHFDLFPPAGENGMPDYQQGQQLRQAALGDLQEPRSPVAEEQMDERSWLIQPGYDFTVR